MALADDGAEYVIKRYRDSLSNMQAMSGKIIGRAGLSRWSKLFQNLRASRHPAAMASMQPA